MLAVHPFPARMAPELAQERIRALDRSSVVLDPMMGSGTFPVAAARDGHVALGIDTDPLALLIAETAHAQFDEEALRDAGEAVSAAARAAASVELCDDAETRQFIDYWFDPNSRDGLAKLAAAILSQPPELHSALWCAFSRLIITKDAGASRARDVSHSRPHRVRDMAAIDPLESYLGAVETIIKRTRPAAGSHNPGTLGLLRADARALPLPAGSIDAIMTSPPYLVAIDYLRGHRMSLVWMGFTVGELRALRGDNIGSERGGDAPDELAAIARGVAGGELSRRASRILAKYVADLGSVVAEIGRVLRPGGTATFVVADARVEGVAISIRQAVADVAELNGLTPQSETRRVLPADKRYLPPPEQGASLLKGRMREETVLTFARPTERNHSRSLARRVLDWATLGVRRQDQPARG